MGALGSFRCAGARAEQRQRQSRQEAKDPPQKANSRSLSDARQLLFPVSGFRRSIAWSVGVGQCFRRMAVSDVALFAEEFPVSSPFIVLAWQVVGTNRRRKDAPRFRKDLVQVPSFVSEPLNPEP